MNLFWFGWDTFSSVIEVITIYFLFEKQLANSRLRISHIIGAIIVFIAELILHILHIDDILLLPVRFVLYLGYACSVFESEKNARIIWGCIAGIMRIAAQIMAYGIASLLDYGHYAEAWFPGSFYFYTEATTTVIYVLITVIATNISNRSNYKFKSVHVVLLIGVCFICIIATSLQMRVVYTLSAIAGTQITQKYAVLVCICFLVVLVLIVWMINSLGKESYRNMEKTLELQQARVEGNYYRDMEASLKAIRELRHDMKTHMHVMRGLMNEGNIEALNKYFYCIEDRYNAECTVFVTNNMMLNALLTSKQLVAERYHIPIRLNYSSQLQAPLSQIDFCSLIGNLLDNAIEACQKVMDEENRYVNISIGDKGDMIYIKVINSTDGIYNIKNGELHTTKIGNTHGIGLKRVASIAESVGGFFDISPEFDSFTAVVMLPFAE